MARVLTPSAFGTSPKSDRSISVVIQSSHVGFGGGRWGSGVVAQVESLQGRMDASERQVEGLSPKEDASRFKSFLSEAFV